MIAGCLDIYQLWSAINII